MDEETSKFRLQVKISKWKNTNERCRVQIIGIVLETDANKNDTSNSTNKETPPLQKCESETNKT